MCGWQSSELPDSTYLACKILTVSLVAFILRRNGSMVFALVVLFVFTGAWTPTSTARDRAQLLRVHQVIDTADGFYRVLMHGSTIHGADACAASGVATAGR